MSCPGQLKNAIANHTPNRLFRFALTKTLEMELPGCNLPVCESHKETDWPILTEVFEFMKSSLKEAVFLLPRCNYDWKFHMFAREKCKGLNVCTLWILNQYEDLDVIRFDYFWGESSTAASLVDLIKRTLTQEKGRRSTSGAKTFLTRGPYPTISLRSWAIRLPSLWAITCKLTSRSRVWAALGSI